jgi:PAS domain S-box-containing protein
MRPLLSKLDQLGHLTVAEDVLKLVMRGGRIGAWWRNLLTNQVHWSAELEEIFGLPPGGFAGTEAGFYDYVHPDDRAQVMRVVKDAVARQVDYVCEFRYRRADGAEGWMEGRGRATYQDDGSPHMLYGVGIEITPRKQAEARQDQLLRRTFTLQRITAALASSLTEDEVADVLVQHVPDLFGVKAGAIMVVSPQANSLVTLRHFGLSLHAAQAHRTVSLSGGAPVADAVRRGMPVWLENAAEMAARYPEYAAPAREVGDAAWAVLPMLAREHTVGALALRMDRARPISPEERGILTTVGQLFGQALHRARLSEEQRRRIEFEQHLIGIVSHDLKNPLAAITLSCQALVQRGGLDERTLVGLRRIRGAAERAAGLVRELLDFAQARGDGVPIKPAPMDLGESMTLALEDLRGLYPGREIALVAHGELRGAWDRERLIQVVGNLVTNALSYGAREAPVTVRLRGKEGAAVLEVHNLGAPIPAERLARIFLPLQRSNEEESATGRSVGLGLFIVERIVHAHGGTVTVRSNAEEGTTFTVRLPR